MWERSHMCSAVNGVKLSANGMFPSGRTATQAAGEGPVIADERPCSLERHGGARYRWLECRKFSPWRGCRARTLPSERLASGPLSIERLIIWLTCRFLSVLVSHTQPVGIKTLTRTSLLWRALNNVRERIPVAHDFRTELICRPSLRGGLGPLLESERVGHR